MDSGRGDRMKASPLFRAEVLQRQAGNRLGVTLSLHAPALLVWSGVALVVITVVLWFVLRVPINQTVVVRGHLIPSQGALKVLSPSPGTVSRVYVREGQRVREGQQLATIRHTVFNASGEPDIEEERQQVRDELQRQQRRDALIRHDAALRQQALEERRQAGDRERALLDSQRQLLLRRLALANRTLERQTVMQARGSVADAVRDQALDAVFLLEQSVVSVQQEIAEREATLTAITHELRRLPVQRDRELLEVADAVARLHARERALFRRGEFSLMAPVGGVVNNLLSAQGATVDIRIPFLDILPEGSVLEARLYVPSRALGELAQGQTVLLALDAFPSRRYGYFPARLLRLADTAMDPREHLLPVDLQETVYLVRAQPLPREGTQQIQLRAGMQFTAHVITGRQTLFERISAPLRTIGGRLWG